MSIAAFSLSDGVASRGELIAQAAYESGFAREHLHAAEAGKVEVCR